MNQLVWEKNEAAGKAWQYTYDLGGNILTKTEYDYANGMTSNPQAVSYTYGNTAWGDLLTAYDGQPITYDGLGNPTSYRGWSMAWQGGRQLAGMTNGTDTLSFAYNENGLRTEKTVNNVTRKYVWNGSQLLADIGPSDAFYFHYNSGGEMVGYTYKTANAETECILVKNLQGDVEKVIATDGTVLASYTYDAWGKVLTSTGSLANANPIRYRGYYYDTETGLYYLKSRCYDPEAGRFINADGFASTGQGMIGTNAFAYCSNNAVGYKDPTGLRMVPVDLRDSGGYQMINGQIYEPFGNYQIASSNAGRIGCGPVAVYNVLTTLKKNHHYKEVFEVFNSIAKRNILKPYWLTGFSVREMREALDYFQIPYEEVNSAQTYKELQAPTLFILLTWNNTPYLSGMHYFAVLYDGSEYTAYNRYSKVRGPYSFESFDDLLGKGAFSYGLTIESN